MYQTQIFKHLLDLQAYYKDHSRQLNQILILGDQSSIDGRLKKKNICAGGVYVMLVCVSVDNISQKIKAI